MADDREGSAGAGAGARPEAKAAADDYQAAYMAGAGGALYHDKIKAPLGYHLIFLLPLFATLGSAAVGRAPAVIPLVTSVVLLFVWLLFSVLRITVSKGEVYVQYGLFGPRIPVADIEKCEAVDYDWKQYGGWGIRYGRDGSVAYNMLGDAGHAVRITYKKKGKQSVVLVASRDPVRLAAAVNEAREAALGGRRIDELPPPPVRVDIDPAALKEAEAEVEAALAEGEAEAERKA